MTLAGAALGIAFAAAGVGLHALLPGARPPLAVALGAVTLAYALSELGFVRLPVPGRDWQVPATWVRDGFYRPAAIFGGVVGLGIFTRIPYASLPILLGWLVVSGNVVYGLIAGLLYGSFRAASIYLGSGCADTEQLVQLSQRLMAMIPRLHQVTGVALAVFAAYLIAAPFL